ncbi:unnamed protein product, partial [Meganyctiphanes norvegica]
DSEAAVLQEGLRNALGGVRKRHLARSSLLHAHITHLPDVAKRVSGANFECKPCRSHLGVDRINGHHQRNRTPVQQNRAIGDAKHRKLVLTKFTNVRTLLAETLFGLGRTDSYEEGRVQKNYSSFS